MRGRSLLAGALFAAACLVCGSQPGLAQPGPKKGGTINIGINTDLTVVDPHYNAAFISTIILSHVFEGLVSYGEKLEYVPVLCERWEISPDYRTYTFYLRKGKLFHHGPEMTSADVKFSIDRIFFPNIPNPRRNLFQRIDRVEAVDRYTVRVHMKAPEAGLLGRKKSTSSCLLLTYVSP